MAKQQRVFTMNGRKFYSIMDMAREIGVERIYSKDFEKYGIVEITGTPEADQPDSPVDESKDTTTKSTKSGKKSAKAEKSATKPSKVTYTIEDLIKMSLEDFSKNVRKIETSELVEFADKHKIESFPETDDERIRRMKVVMEYKKKYFPNQSIPPKKVSFKGVATKELIKFAKEKKVDYKKSPEDKIQKMWVIYALNQAGYYDLPKTKEKAKAGKK